MDLKLTSIEPSPAERAAVDGLLGPPAGAAALRAERGGSVLRAQRHRLLPALWALVERVGHISPEGLGYVARRLGVPPAEAYGVASFYAVLPLAPMPTAHVAHVCVDLSCRLAGERSAELRARLAADPDTTVVDSPCLGLCERAPAALVSTPGAPPQHRLEAAPRREVAQRGDASLVLLRRVDVVDPTDLDAYRAHGGYAALRRAFDIGPTEVLREVLDAGLVGRGGAAFPTGRKWQAVAAQPARPHHLVCNADESEPGTFKDRVLMEGDPFAVVEAMTIAGFATGCEHGWIYLRGEYPLAARRLQDAIDAARAKGLLGADVMGRGLSFDIEVFRGAGAYICGEETAIFNSIEGYRGEPRSKPPFPVEVGLFGRPTVVNNVETLVNVLPIVQFGAAAYRRVGTESSPGTKLFCLSGPLVRPGTYEVPFGTTLRELLALAGGVVDGRPVRAVLLGGAAGSFVGPDRLDLPLTFEDTRAAGTTVGSGVVIVFDDRADLLDAVGRIAAFFRDESCGQCVPCRVGTVRQEEALVRLTARRDALDVPGSTAGDLQLLRDVGRAMRDASICGLGQTAWNAVESAIDGLDVFGDSSPEEGTE
ncbi:MAG: NAD(P)H-dependent oxidoreductase subunit E [Acidimicrobiales bacterium]|nr:NAD(P)H-dependent oxidoreductase subunit E [Acidimicrobiales bacterium]